MIKNKEVYFDDRKFAVAFDFLIKRAWRKFKGSLKSSGLILKSPPDQKIKARRKIKVPRT